MKPIVTCVTCGGALSESAEGRVCDRCATQKITSKPARFDAAALGLSEESTGTQEETFGDYSSLERIDRGGMGVVYRAWHREHGRMVALKILAGRANAPEAHRERFKEEVKALGALDHPNIIPLYEAGEVEGTPYYSMKLMEGENLATILHRRPGPMLTSVAALLISKIAQAVHHAHQRGVLHRDLKPSNILVEHGTGEPHLIDFGVAKLEFSDRDLTQTESLLGTVPYMSPEQAAGNAKGVTVASDVWGLGVLLYELLTGQVPFRGETREETLIKILREEPPGLRTLNHSLDRDIETICKRCLIKEPGGRYASAAALAEDLQRWLAREPILARKVGSVERLTRWCRRKPALAALAAVSGMSLLMAAIALLNWGISLRLAEQRRLYRYVLDMNLARREQTEGNLWRVRESLSAHLPPAGKRDVRGFEWHLLASLAQSQHERTLFASNQVILSVAVSTDESIFVAALPQQLAVMREDSKSAVLLPARWDKHVSLAVDAVGQRVFAASTAGVTVQSLTLETNLLLLSKESGNRVAWSEKSGRLAAGRMLDSNLERPGRLQIWEGSPLRLVTTISNISVSAMQWQSEGAELFVMTRRGELLTWNSGTRRLQTVFQTRVTTYQAAFSADGRQLARIEEGGKLVVSDLRGQGRRVFGDGYPMHATRVTFSADGNQLIISGGVDQRLHILNVTTGREQFALQGHMGSVESLTRLPQGNQVLTGSRDGTVRLWSMSPKSHSQPLQFPHNVASMQPQAPVFSRDGRHLAMLLEMHRPGRDALVWALDTGLAAAHVPALPVGFSSDGRELMAWSSGLLQRYQLPKVRPEEAFRLLENPALEPQLSEDGRRLFCLDRQFKLWAFDAAERKLINSCTTRTDGFQPAPDGRGAIVLGPAPMAGYWDVASGAVKVLATDRRYDAISISADGTMAAIGSWSGIIRVFALPSGRPMLQYQADAGGVSALAFSKDGRTLLSGSQEGYLRFLNLATEREAMTIRLNGSIAWLRFSPGGETLVAGTLSYPNETNGTYYVWRTGPGVEGLALGQSLGQAPPPAEDVASPVH